MTHFTILTCGVFQNGSDQAEDRSCFLMSFSVSRIGQRNLLQSGDQFKQAIHCWLRGQQISFKYKIKFSRSLTKALQGEIKREGWGSRYYIWPGEGGEMKIENCK